MSVHFLLKEFVNSLARELVCDVPEHWHVFNVPEHKRMKLESVFLAEFFVQSMLGVVDALSL